MSGLNRGVHGFRIRTVSYLFVSHTKFSVLFPVPTMSQNEEDISLANDGVKTGVAFSGGGIRSAALCSGVLRRLLQRKCKMDYLSCVSGGGYTGTAYLDWKYHKGKEDNKEWHEAFFDHMKQKAGYMCDWQKPISGIIDSIILVSLVLLVNLVEPVFIWGAYACPVAFIIDFLFGKLLREKVNCEAGAQSSSDLNATARAVRDRCLIDQGSPGFDKIILFLVLGALFALFYIFSKRIRKYSSALSFISTIFVVFLFFTFFPFAIHDFFVEIPRWTEGLFIVMGVIVWSVLPLARRKTSFILVIYVYSYVIYWKVYDGAKLLDIVYSDELFNRLLFTSGFALWFAPVLDASHRRLVHVFNRWRLQKAFYSREGSGTTGCAGIGLQDICPLWTCLSRDTDRQTAKSLSLADLEGMEPQYISNMVFNGWRAPDCDDDFGILTMSPTGIERLGNHDPSEQEPFEGKLGPRDVKLSDAMATSAAALSKYPGFYGASVEGLVRLQTLLGLEMGASLITDVNSVKNESCLMKMLPFLLQVIRGLPLICVPALYYSGGTDSSITTRTASSITAGVFVFFFMHLILAFIAIMNTGARNPSGFEKLIRWFIVHVPFVNIVRELMSIDNEGSIPPPILLLSDGGLVENLGILPLLKKRLKKIVVVDGGYTSNEKSYGDSLLNALRLARIELNCGFTGWDGRRDVITDLLEKFVHSNAGNALQRKPRHFRFKVQYYEDDTQVGEGEILLIKPRSPNEGERGANPVTWKQIFRDIDVGNIDAEAANWEPGPYLTSRDVDDLTFCCCECCQTGNKTCEALSAVLCGVFPFNSTANQFFTPRMFSAYHSEGYRACVEAEAAEFLSEEQPNMSVTLDV